MVVLCGHHQPINVATAGAQALLMDYPQGDEPSCGVRDKIKDSTSPFLRWTSSKVTKGLTALTSEIDCDQTPMGLPPVTSVFLIAK
jgi:hypothetical protein